MLTINNGFVLGLSFGYHDSSAAIVKDGNVIVAISEERLSRVKHDSSFPFRSIAYCLDYAGISITELSKIVYYEDYIKKFDRLLNMGCVPGNDLFFNETYKAWERDKKIDPILQISSLLGFPYGEIVSIEHHLSHAAAAFFCSTYQEAAVLTIDGVGEYETITIYQGLGNRLTKLYSVELPNSIGLVYSAFTNFLGFEANEGEYKVMGMASYGKPVYRDKIKKIICNEDGSLNIDKDFFDFFGSYEKQISSSFYKEFGLPRDKDSIFIVNKNDTNFSNDVYEKSLYYSNIASSIQDVANEVVTYYAKMAIELCETNTLCFGGGVALNAAINGRLRDSIGLDGFFVQPAAGDAGSAIGCALYYTHSMVGIERNYRPFVPYLGKCQNDQFLLAELQSSFYTDYDKIDDEAEFVIAVAKLLSKNMVIGWLHGRSEFGPRALGSRSIIASPISESIRDIVNEKIKHRELFRPFAPAVLAEEAEKWFFLPSAIDENAPENYMVSLAVAKELAVKMAPAIVHTDGTSRVQLVTSSNNLFYALIAAFNDITSVPILLNTSFNLKGEPIVETLTDALRTFSMCDMDCIAAYPFIIRKGKQ